MIEGTSKQRGARWLGRIEPILAVLLLCLIALLLAPRLSRAARSPKDATLADCLRYLRTQIQVYAIQHHDLAPGYPDGDTAKSPDYPTFLAQLTQPTDEHGRVVSSQCPSRVFGPYVAFLPANPVTLRTGVLIVNGNVMPAPDESQPYGWFYNPRTREIMPNASGADAKGVPYSSY
jgi:hypothetical protein